jgi:uncharacterized protein
MSYRVVAADFSLESPLGVRFLTRGRVFSEAELAALKAAPPLTGAEVEAGARPAEPDSPTIISASDLADICPVPGVGPFASS